MVDAYLSVEFVCYHSIDVRDIARIVKDQGWMESGCGQVVLYSGRGLKGNILTE